jgi:hypothetical protein
LSVKVTARKPKKPLRTLVTLLTRFALFTLISSTIFLSGCSTRATLYKRGGVTIAIPNEYTSQLFINPVELDDESILISVYQKSAHEKQPGMGFLFSIARYTAAQYEQFLTSDGSGRSFFARDDTHYYGFFYPTDVQAPDDYAAYEELFLSLGDFVRSDFIRRNRLTAYSDDEFFGRTYTYDGEHVFIKYYPYYAVNGSKDEVWTLYLSQPVKQGDGGIWCVERWRDQYGNVYPYFPDGDGVPSREYYAALQREADAQRQDPLFDPKTSLFDPEHVALEFVERVFGHAPSATGSLERAENSGTPAELFARSTGNIHDYLPRLVAGEGLPVSAYDLLPCLADFTRDTWSELHLAYGSEWWAPFWNALRDAALSDKPAEASDQVMRNFYVGKAFLAADGAYTEMISDLVLRQWRYDSRLYNMAMRRFSDDEAATLRSHLSYLVSHRGGTFSLGIPGTDPELSLSLNTYPIDFPFGVDLTETSRESFDAEGLGPVTIIECEGLQLKYLYDSEGVYFVYCIRTVREGYFNKGVAVGDQEEKLWDHWLPEQLRKMDRLSHEDEDWFGEDYDHGYVYAPEESTKSIMYLIKNGRVAGIGLVDGIFGSMY